MGKTGTGKSTLLNYLCDSRIAETGSGKPVTGEGIYEYSVTINGQEVRVFDSWGIEAGKVERWKSLIDQSLKEHGVQKRMEDWFHSVIYCIQAGGGRVEEIDTEIIRRFLIDGYLLTVVLTKADQVDEQDEQQMRKVILNELKSYIPSSGKGEINIISTCAERKKTRAGETKPFGKEEVQKAILEGWKETVMERLPKHVVARLCELVDEWKEDELQEISSAKVSGLHGDNRTLYDKVFHDAKVFSGSIKKQCENILSEAVQSTKKANTSLSVMLDVNLDEMSNNSPSPDPRIPKNVTKWIEVLLGIPLVIINAVPAIFKTLPAVIRGGEAIFETIQRNSSSKQDAERKQLEAYIDKVAEGIKSCCEDLESKIATELKKAL